MSDEVLAKAAQEAMMRQAESLEIQAARGCGWCGGIPVQAEAVIDPITLTERVRFVCKRHTATPLDAGRTVERSPVNTVMTFARDRNGEPYIVHNPGCPQGCCS